MSARAVIRHETWALEPDREPDAEPVTHAMECAVCGESSGASEDFAEGQLWVLKHCGKPVPPHLPGVHHAIVAYVAAWDVTGREKPRLACCRAGLLRLTSSHTFLTDKSARSTREPLTWNFDVVTDHGEPDGRPVS
jgi:hypothetical protein